jgi:MFS family permease
VENIWALSVLTAILWFCGGLGMGLIGILAGLSAGKDERGKIFGILSLTIGLGALIGGLATGFIVDRWGFPTMCSAVAGLLVFWPLAGIFLTEKMTGQVHGEDGLTLRRSGLGKNYYLLFAACLISSIAGFIVILGRSLLMSDLGFRAMEIASTGAVGGFVAMPLPLIMGWLSDRTDRKIFLFFGYLACFFGLSILAISTSLWHFWIVMIFQSVFSGMNGTIGNAMVADLLPPESLGRGLALFGATSWLGGILGFAGAGFALKSLGVLPTLIIGMCLALVAILLLIPIRSMKERNRPSNR